MPIFYADPTKVLKILELINPLTPGHCGHVMDHDVGSPNSVMIYGDSKGRKQIRQYIGSFGTYQESCPLGVLELRTSMQLTSI